MQDKNLEKFNAIAQYTDWNDEMTDLYNKYSLVSELNNELMRQCPIVAMYTLSEYLKRQRYELEAEINRKRMQIIGRAGQDPVQFGIANDEADKMTYETLKPIIEDYMTARFYVVEAMHKSKEEFDAYCAKRDELHNAGKTK